VSAVFVWVLLASTPSHSSETFVGVYRNERACQDKRTELLRDANVAALSAPGVGLVWTCSKVPLH
jgi:hypothetical protein